MPMLIRWRHGRALAAEDPFTCVHDDQTVPRGDVILSLTRFQGEGDHLLGQGRSVGVRLAPDEAPEALADWTSRLAVIALEFPRYRDGRPYSAARVLRERLAFPGEVRAVGEVLIDQARFMIRCGFDAFEPADGSTAQDWSAAASRFRHVYQRANDDAAPAFLERLEQRHGL